MTRLRADSFSEMKGVGAVKMIVQKFLDRNPEAKQYVESLRWRGRIYTSGRRLQLFFQWLAGRPGWIVSDGVSTLGIVGVALDRQHRANTDRDRRNGKQLEMLLLQFCRNEVHGTKNWKLAFYMAVHGLFSYNSVDLPMKKDELSKVLLTSENKGVTGNLTLDEIRRTIDTMKTRERAIYTLIFQGFLDSERMIEINTGRYMLSEPPFHQQGWAQIKPQLERGGSEWWDEWIEVDFPRGRKKNELPYYVLYHRDSDAVRALNAHLKEYGEPPRTGVNERGGPLYAPLFHTNAGLPPQDVTLGQNWLSALVRADIVELAHPYCPMCGIPTKYYKRTRQKIEGWRCSRCKEFQRGVGRGHVQYGKGKHEMRDTLRTYLPSVAGVNKELVEFFMGHQVDPLNYAKFMNAKRDPVLRDWIRSEWTKALPFLNLWTGTSSFTNTAQRIQDLETRLKERDAKLYSLQAQVNNIEAVLRGLRYVIAPPQAHGDQNDNDNNSLDDDNSLAHVAQHFP